MNILRETTDFFNRLYINKSKKVAMIRDNRLK